MCCVIKALNCIAKYLPHKMIPLASTMSCSSVEFLPAGAIQAVEDRVGEVVSMRLGRKPPGEFDEAGGDE